MSKKIIFPKNDILRVMESMRRPNGAFIASLSPEYQSMWLRDTLYTSYVYWYLGDYDKLRQGIQIGFDYLKNDNEQEKKAHYRKLKLRIASPADIPEGIIHAKCDADTFQEITTNDGWGHHQLDWIGLFLHIIADLDLKNVRIIRDGSDIEILQLLTYYLRSVEYWIRPDRGMWEECTIRHATSIGAVAEGLNYVRSRRLIDVGIPDPLITWGERALQEILPYESRDACGYHHHRHCCDAAQLTLFWPYKVIVNPRHADELLKRIVDGHTTDQGERHHLVQAHGLNRYWGDDYYRSTQGHCRGISAEWPMFKFWLSIVYSQRHEQEPAFYWFQEACKEIIDTMIPEAYQNNRPNPNTPLAWAHAIALIAFQKLSFEQQKELSE